MSDEPYTMTEVALAVTNSRIDRAPCCLVQFENGEVVERRKCSYAVGSRIRFHPCGPWGTVLLRVESWS